MAFLKPVLFVTLAAFFMQACDAGAESTRPEFDVDRDLYLPQFDSKTDVDDVHSVAGVATLLRGSALEGVNYHAVAGAYGIQEGLYVPSPELFELAFGDNWSDAHENREKALQTVADLVSKTLKDGGSVWAADAGQSDFTADWLRMVNDSGMAELSKANVHVVQHSDWNESVTSPDKLAYVKANTNYHRIKDGNTVGNGTPGFNTASGDLWETVLADPETGELWRIARDIGNEYNGKDGRYLNDSIKAGGMDFSDVAESCWIFGYQDLVDAGAFFSEFLERE